MATCSTDGCEREAAAQWPAECDGTTGECAEHTAAVSAQAQEWAASRDAALAELAACAELDAALADEDPSPDEAEMARRGELVRVAAEADVEAGFAARDAASRTAAHTHPVFACQSHLPADINTAQEGS